MHIDLVIASWLICKAKIKVKQAATEANERDKNEC
jgi:hypothetical protein